ncbi:roquin-2-like [Hydra vulgaris]|uniref:Roquin-2-like n=1 Tax=Hydra vulgaris TaxID=6087 RepID=A0ABM4B3I5_HYDVU
MQLIIDKLQTSATFSSSLQELFIEFQRTYDPENLEKQFPHFEKLASIDPNPEGEPLLWKDIGECMTSLLVIVSRYRIFAKAYANKNKGNIYKELKYRKCRNVPAGHNSPDSCENNLKKVKLYFFGMNAQYRTQVTSNNAPNGSPFSPICSTSKIDEG